MKILMFVSTVLLAFSSAVFAQMSNGHSGMMGDNWGWGMSYGWGFGLIIAVLVILGVMYAIKRR
jgi:hypothetical protein